MKSLIWPILALLTYFPLECFPASAEVEQAFNPDSDEDSYQRRYVVNVANKAQDCYFIPDVRMNQVLNFHYVVSLN